MNRLTKLVLLIALIGSATTLRAQNGDFGIWSNVGATKRLAKGLTLGVEGEFRSRDNASEVDRWAVGLDIGYKPFTFLKFGAGYTYIYNHTAGENETKYGLTTKKRPRKTIKTMPSFWQSRQRFNFDVSNSSN